VLTSFKQIVDHPFQFGCDSKGMKPWQTPPLNKAPSKAKPSQAKQSQGTGEKKEQRERTQVRARKKDMMFGIKRRFTCLENLPVKSTKVEMCMFGIKRRFTCLENLPVESTKVEICSACFIYLLFVT